MSDPYGKDYDPRNDPRYVPPQETFRPDPEEFGAVLAELDRRVRECDRLMEMFDTPGWEGFVTQYEGQLEMLDLAMEKAPDQAQWMLLRGQAVALRSVLSLPERVVAKKKMLLDQQRDLMSVEEEDQDVSTG